MRAFVLLIYCVVSCFFLQGSSVKVDGKTFIDEKGVFTGLGATYFQALRHSVDNRDALLDHNLAFLAERGVNYIRIVAMIKDNGSGEWPASREIIPSGDAYWKGFRKLLDKVWARGMRVEITILTSTASLKSVDELSEQKAFFDRLMKEVIMTKDKRGVIRLHKVLMFEVANEWFHETQKLNGKQLKELTAHIRKRLKPVAPAFPVAVSSPEKKKAVLIDEIYSRSANVFTFHFSRRVDKQNGWEPVVDCEDIYTILKKTRLGVVAVSSNEPVGPGSSIMSEVRADRLVMAAAYTWSMELPLYVYHCAAGVGIDLKVPERFDDKLMPGLKSMGKLLEILPESFLKSSNYRVFDIKGGKVVRIRGRRTGKSVWTFIPGAEKIKLKCLEKLSGVDVYDPWTMEKIISGQNLKKGEVLDLSEWQGESLIISAEIPL